MEAIRVQAKYCLVTACRIFHPAQLVIRHGRLVEVVQGRPCAPDIDLGDTLLMPGLINAHTHLEFSLLQQPFPAGENFPSWISQVVRYRAAQQSAHAGEVATRTATKLQRALHAGMQEAFHSGSTVVGDIVTAPWLPQDYPTAQQFAQQATLEIGENSTGVAKAELSGRLSQEDWRTHIFPISYPRSLPFTELIGMSADRAAASWQWCQAAKVAAGAELAIGVGVSPHAPYSVHLPTLASACKSMLPTTRVAMHVAESREELEWLEQGRGAFSEVFERLGLQVEATTPSVMDCIELLARFRHSLLIHGNYLNPIQIERLAAAPNITVVYCPRTHSHFGHTPYPVDALRGAGVRLVLGTDSRASNPSLSLWDEVFEAARQHSGRAPSEWLRSVTADAARGLGIADDFGSLEVGRWATAVAIPVRADRTAKGLLEDLCAKSSAELHIQPLSNLLRP